MEEPRSVLFICTGNTSRSPIAEHLLRHLAKQRGIQKLTTQSAGTSPAIPKTSPRTKPNPRKNPDRYTWGTSPWDMTRQLILERTGQDPGTRKRNNIKDLDLSQYTDILCMEQHHKQKVTRLLPPTDREKAATLGEAVGSPNTEIFHQNTRRSYQRFADLLQDMLTRWLKSNYPQTKL